jgi:hypothetical protein
MRHSNANSVLYFPCINCEELISSKLIERHSRECVDVSMTVRAIDESRYQVDEVHFKLNKLVSQLQRLMASQSTSERKKYLVRLYELG